VCAEGGGGGRGDLFQRLLSYLLFRTEKGGAGHPCLSPMKRGFIFEGKRNSLPNGRMAPDAVEKKREWEYFRAPSTLAVTIAREMEVQEHWP
jgi:hypothetical protein